MNSGNPNCPPNPNDPALWKINVHFFVEELQKRLRDLKCMSLDNFTDPTSKGYHLGQIATYEAVITLVMKDIYT